MAESFPLKSIPSYYNKFGGSTAFHASVFKSTSEQSAEHEIFITSVPGPKVIRIFHAQLS